MKKKETFLLKSLVGAHGTPTFFELSHHQPDVVPVLQNLKPCFA